VLSGSTDIKIDGGSKVLTSGGVINWEERGDECETRGEELGPESRKEGRSHGMEYKLYRTDRMNLKT